MRKNTYDLFLLFINQGVHQERMANVENDQLIAVTQNSATVI